MATGGAGSPGRRFRASSTLLLVLGGLLALYLLVPVGILLGHLASGDGAGASGLGSALGVSALSATIAAAVIGLLGVPLAWALAHFRGWLTEAISVLVALPLALPPLMSGILLIEVVGPYTWLGRQFDGRLTDSLAGIVLAQVFVAAPFLVVAGRSAFAAVDPELLDVAASLGHGGWSRFWRVSLPVARRGIEAGLALSWLRAFGEFGATVILAYHPYSLPVFTFVQFSSTGVPTTLIPTAAALGAAAVVLVLARLLVTRPAVKLGGRRLASGPPAPADAGLARSPRRAHERLDVAVSAQVGDFVLDLEYQAATAHLAILGPSGAGKSLALRCLAGLRPSAPGRVRLGKRVLDRLAPERRRVGWVPQGAALLPHLSVRQQVSFGTRADEAAVRAWLSRLDLTILAGRRPHELSGGQRQRVALARALASAPDLLLLDEPFSALDRPVREQMRRLVRELQRELGICTVIVTHDPEEAGLLAEEVILLANGRALQSGLRAEVFRRPSSAQVAELLAIANLRSGQMLDGRRLLAEGTELAVAPSAPPSGAAVTWCVRAEHIMVWPFEDRSQPSRHPGRVLDVIDLGAVREISVVLDGGLRLLARWALTAPSPGARCAIEIPPDAINVWTAEPAPTAEARD